MNVYVVGPCSAGKTTLADALGLLTTDSYIGDLHPDLEAAKPWRHWLRPDDPAYPKEKADEWEAVQKAAWEELASKNGYAIGHVGAYLSADLDPGLTIWLEPHLDAALKQRADKGDDALEITKLCVKSGLQRKDEVLNKAQKLGGLIDTAGYNPEEVQVLVATLLGLDPELAHVS